MLGLDLDRPCRLPRSPSPLVGEDRLGRSPSEEGGRHEFLDRASGFDGTARSAPPALHARRAPSPLGLAPESALPHEGGEGAAAAVCDVFNTAAEGPH
jgi:hypothetical protein